MIKWLYKETLIVKNIGYASGKKKNSNKLKSKGAVM